MQVTSAPMTISEQIQRRDRQIDRVKLVAPWIIVALVAVLVFRKTPWQQILPWMAIPLVAALLIIAWLDRGLVCPRCSRSLAKTLDSASAPLASCPHCGAPFSEPHP
jgi:hypothetical protein